MSFISQAQSVISTGVYVLCYCLLLLMPVSVMSSSNTSAEDYEAGEELYDLACANCHGKNLVNPGTTSFNLKDFPKDQEQRFVESVTKGKGFMPALGDVFDSDEIRQIWIYVSQHK